MVLQCCSAAQLRPALQQLGKTWLRNPALLLGNLCQFVCSHTSLSLLVFPSWSLTWHNFWWGFKMCKYCALRSDYCTNSSVPWVWASSTYYKKNPYNSSDTSLSSSDCENGLLSGFHPWLPEACGTPWVWCYVIFSLMLSETSVGLLNLQSVEELWCAV